MSSEPSPQEFAVDESPQAEPEPSGYLDRTIETLMNPPSRPFSQAKGDLKELWNPEEGGVKRLVYVGEELAVGGGMPLLVHIPIGILEVVYSDETPDFTAEPVQQEPEPDEWGDDWTEREDPDGE